MDNPSTLIIGGNGQLGLALRDKFPKAKWVDANTLDIANINKVESFDWSGIKTIINAAAYTNVDGAETIEGRKIAWSVNSCGVKNLVSIASKHDILIVHISTDYIFDGTLNPHYENEDFSPLSVYGATKAAGDIIVDLAPKHYILRTSWVIGEGKNFVRTMLELAEKNISPTVVNDQIGRLTFTSELVRAIDHLLSTSAPYGTYNLSNSGESVSWADITREIFKLIGRTDLTVTNTTTADYYKGKEGVAHRPLNSTLDLTKISSTGFEFIDWRAQLKEYIEKETS